MANGPELRVGDVLVVLSWHAIDRYHERVRPTLYDRDAVVEELRRIAESAGRVDPVAPEWYIPDERDDYRGVRWLMLGDAIGMPITYDRVALTCLVQGAIGESIREAKRMRRKHRSKVRRAIRASGQKVSDRDFGQDRMARAVARSR